MDKLYFTYNQIHKIVQDLMAEVEQSGFSPDLFLAIGTGGFIPARMAKTFMDRPLFAIGLSYYDLNNKPSDTPVVVQWLDQPEAQLKGKKVLLIDEVDDSRATIGHCLAELQNHQIAEVCVLVLHNKRKEKKAPIPPYVKHYFIGEHQEDRWLCYPWDAPDIDEQDRLAQD